MEKAYRNSFDVWKSYRKPKSQEAEKPFSKPFNVLINKCFYFINK